MEHRLTRYRQEHDLTLDGFAERISVAKSQVWKWENGAIPRPAQMQKIIACTGGEVTANDWYTQEPAE